MHHVSAQGHFGLGSFPLLKIKRLGFDLPRINRALIGLMEGSMDVQDTSVEPWLESSGDSDSDVIMCSTILLVDSDTDLDQRDVEPPCKRQRNVYEPPVSDSEFEFESIVDTDDEVTPFQFEERTDNISIDTMYDRPILRRLPVMTGDESDDVDDTVEDPVSGGQCNPQDGLSPNQFENTGDLHAGDDDTDDSDLNLEGADSESTQSWGEAWAQDPNNVDPHRLWQVALPLPQPMPGPPGPLVDPQVIRVTFEQRMRVEMRFSPGLRFGPPQTRVLSSHWALVSTNF